MFRVAFALAVAQVAVGWQLAHYAATPSGVLALATVGLAVAAIALVTGAPCAQVAICAGPTPRRAVALRRKSWGAVFQRQRNPDSPGRARPRAPSAAPAAA
ncbi:MAG TPA: DUF6412 domain-containing protein [Streptosporangiaceae bacterium]|nr:DUF6412 domain-containing protein [Streptosporangiaceae bacterium]